MMRKTAWTTLRVVSTIVSAAMVAALFVRTAAADTTRYFRQIAYNHMSPWVPIRGIHEITSEQAGKAIHYVFRHDDANRLVEIVNHNPEAWKQHPLASIGSYRVTFEWTDTTETRRFFDHDGKAIKGVRGAYQEVFTRDPSGFRTALAFLDEKGAPVDNVWKIARYEWTRRNDWVIERRFNAAGTPVPVSSYFNFGVTGMKLGADGVPTGHYNLDPDTLLPANNPDGVASYNDVFDTSGNHVEVTYRDKSGALVNNGWKYATMRKVYDARGNVLRQEIYDVSGKPEGADVYTYDDVGQLLTKARVKG